MLYLLLGICCLAIGGFVGYQFGYDIGYEEGDDGLAEARAREKFRLSPEGYKTGFGGHS